MLSNGIKFFNDDGSEYIPTHDSGVQPTIPFAEGTPGMVLVGISNDSRAIPLNRIGDMLSSYVNKFPALIQATPDVSVGLCVFDTARGGWRPLTVEDLHAPRTRG